MCVCDERFACVCERRRETHVCVRHEGKFACVCERRRESPVG